MRIALRFTLCSAVLLPLACSHTPAPVTGQAAIPPRFQEYWFDGKAEISVYDLQQARYGEMRGGEAVMVFVTEPFSARKQVKLDAPEDAGTDRTDVLKLNMTRNFETGIYPYSTELSVFSPIDRTGSSHALKSVFTCQEWCGQVFTQYNLKGKHYQVQSFSYFESEGDREDKIGVTWLEDELWNVLRIDYRTLPTGSIEVLPAESYTRFVHRERKPEPAVAVLQETDSLLTYELSYASGRVLKIEFDALFPHTIKGWSETYRDGFGGDAKVLTTTAVLRKTLRLDYWKHNAPADSIWRQELGLRSR